MPAGYAGELTIEESPDGVDAFAVHHLHFDADGKMRVRDIGFLNRWNTIGFSFRDGGAIHRETTVAKVRGAYYISSGAMNQNRVMTYTLRKQE